jgi:hypothetical protein
LRNPIRGFRLTFLPACALLAAPAFAQDQPEGPPYLVITYRTAPEKRAALRRFMDEKGVAQFDRWKTGGILADYRIYLIGMPIPIPPGT